MAEIVYNEEFDAVINLFYSFGFFETNEQNFKVLQNFYRALKTGGKFLFHTDVNIPRVLTGKYRQEEKRHLTSGSELEITDKYDPASKRVNGSWIIKHPDGSQTSKSYSVRVYEKDEFVDLCKMAGFRGMQAYSDWDGSGYDSEAEDMIIAAQK
jgi:SAM-dependent methyltransferase